MQPVSVYSSPPTGRTKKRPIHLQWLSCCLILLCGIVGGMRESVGADPHPNILLICVDDLRPELACYGANYIQSPHIDGLADRGRLFQQHFVQAPTCGASRFTLLTGRYGGSSNNALFQRAAMMQSQSKEVPTSLPGWFREHGYSTVSVGKVSHHPGGRGGERWDDSENIEMPNAWDRHLLPAGPWQDPRGWMHGLAHGQIRDDQRREDGTISMHVLQAEEGSDDIYPDGVAIPAALQQLDILAADNSKPFFLAVGLLRPHLPFGAPAKYLEPYLSLPLPSIQHPRKPAGRTTWHGSGEFMKYDRWGRDPNTDPEFANLVRQHYAACVSYADAQVGRLLARLGELGIDDNTIILLWGDHGWHLGEHAIWGKHALFEESLHSPLIISYPDLPRAGEPSAALVETLDIFPTLCDLAHLPQPSFLHGTSLKPILQDPKAEGHPAIAYRSKARTIRTRSHRLIIHNDGYAELYDHTSPAAETRNIADTHPELVGQLTQMIEDRLAQP